MKSQDIIFQGFNSPRYTQVPDEFFDVLMNYLSGAEVKVLLYIIRRTFGFKKDFDNISLHQICNGITTKDGEVLDNGTGLSLSTVQTAIKGLIEKNTIIARRNSSKEKGDEPTTYSLNILQNLPLTENRQGGIPKIGNGGYRKSVTQETVLQKTVIQHRNSNNEISVNEIKTHEQNISKGIKSVSSILENRRKIKSLTKLPEQLKAAIDDVSLEFNDSKNLRSNETRTASIFQNSNKNEYAFSAYIFEAKSITKQQANVKNRMSYFFSVLEDILRGGTDKSIRPQ